MRAHIRPSRTIWTLALAGAAAIGGLTGTHAMRAHHAQRQSSRPLMMQMGKVTFRRERTWVGLYDGHQDIYLSTDVSNKAQAAMMHINFAPALRGVPMKSLPEIYLVEGRAAHNQPAVFGSEPGEKDYSPLWAETLLTWKAGATPLLIKSDNQVDVLEKRGVLTERSGNTILNCPIIQEMKSRS